jgi:cytochrome P450 family 142 subfamily A polypeptide 1
MTTAHSIQATSDRVVPPPVDVGHACEHLLTVVDRDEPRLALTDVAAWMLVAMIGDAAERPPLEREQLVSWSNDMVAGLVGDQSGPAAERAADVYRGLHQFIDGVLERRRRDTSRDGSNASGCSELERCHLVRNSPIDIDEVLPRLVAQADGAIRV